MLRIARFHYRENLIASVFPNQSDLLISSGRNKCETVVWWLKTSIGSLVLFGRFMTKIHIDTSKSQLSEASRDGTNCVTLRVKYVSSIGLIDNSQKLFTRN